MKKLLLSLTLLLSFATAIITPLHAADPDTSRESLRYRFFLTDKAIQDLQDSLAMAVQAGEQANIQAIMTAMEQVGHPVVINQGQTAIDVIRAKIAELQAKKAQLQQKIQNLD